MDSVRQKSRRLRQFLESQIAVGHYPSGGKLPPQRLLSEQFDLARGSVGRVFKELENAGLIELRHGSGAYVRRQNRSQGRRRIALVSQFLEFDRQYSMYIVRGIQQAAARLDCQLQWDSILASASTPEKLENLAAGCDGMILVGPYDLYLNRVPTFLPLVGVDMHRDYGSVSTLNLDPVAAAELAGEFFRRQGKKQAYILRFLETLEFGPSTHSFREAVFADHWRRYGTCRETLVVEQEAWPGHAYKIPESIEPDAGIFCASSDWLHWAVWRYQQDTGRNPLRSLCLLSLDGKPLLFPNCYPQLNTIATDYVQQGEAALEECLRRIENPGCGPRRLYTPVFLKEFDWSVSAKPEKCAPGPSDAIPPPR